MKLENQESYNKDDELISVIVPIYGVEEWLDECVESLVNQSYKNLEIILVDDGSRDRCPQMCDEWSKKDSRIRVVHKENGGLSSARNAGLDVCTGEYVSFIDSDDFIHKDTYKIMMTDMKTRDVDIVRCAMNRYNGHEFIDNRNIKYEKTYNTDEIFDCYFYHKEDLCGGVCDKLFKRELFEDARFPEGLNSEDYYMHLIVYQRTKRMFYNNIPLYFYRMRDDSICRTSKINEHSYDKIIVGDMVGEYVEKHMPERVDDVRAFRIMIRFAIYYGLMFVEHEKELEKDWKKDLKKYVKDMISSKKISFGFKIKYLWFSYFSKSYVTFKKILGN